MKKLLLVLAMFVAITSMTFAQFNPVVTQDASFTGTVIAPLAWVNMENATLDLPTGIAGQTRTFPAASLDFIINGQDGKSFKLTSTTTYVGNDETGVESDVTLTGGWLYADGNYTLTGGTFTQKFSVTGITAAAGAHGTYTWSLEVSAIYIGL